MLSPSSLCTNCMCRRQKEMLKALETPEQKRARRMAKKQEKLRRQRQKEGWNEDYLVSY